MGGFDKSLDCPSNEAENPCLMMPLPPSMLTGDTKGGLSRKYYGWGWRNVIMELRA
jgi:hypothetical protein